MTTLATCLWFADDAEAAATFYVSLLPDSRIDHVQRGPVASPSGPAGGVLVVRFTLAGRPMLALNGGRTETYTNAMSLSVEVETQAEVDALCNALTADGGKEIACGWLNDRWGVPWQIVPAMLPRLLADPDPARAARAMTAMMSMVRLDIAALAAAAR